MEKNSAEMRIGFLTLDWKLNVSALIALVLAITSIIFQLSGYWAGAAVKLLPAEKVYIFGGERRFLIGTRMVYTNDGAEKYSGIVLREKATLKIGNHTIKQWAEERGRYSVASASGIAVPELVDSTDAAPFLVPSAALVSHEVRFAPREYGDTLRRKQDFIRKQDFLALLAKEFERGGRTVTLTFEARVREAAGFSAGEERALRSTCTVSLDNALIKRLSNPGWTSRTCQGFASGIGG